MQCKSFKSVDHEQSTKKLELIHSNICGPMQVELIGGSRYLVPLLRITLVVFRLLYEA